MDTTLRNAERALSLDPTDAGARSQVRRQRALAGLPLRYSDLAVGERFYFEPGQNHDHDTLWERRDVLYGNGDVAPAYFSVRDETLHPHEACRNFTLYPGFPHRDPRVELEVDVDREDFYLR